MTDVTSILQKLDASEDPVAAEDLLKAVYSELHQIAEAKMRMQPPGHTLQPTLLVDEAWLKLFPQGQNPKFNGRAHFFGAAAKVMHRILVDHARRRNALKRGKREEMSEAEFAALAHEAPDDVILAVDEALKTFAQTDASTARLVELRFFVGLSMKEAADALGISLRSAERDCAYFAAWFRRQFGNEVSI